MTWTDRLPYRLKNVNDYISAWHRGYTVNIAIIEVCGLRCPACWIGQGGKVSGSRMERGLWKDIIKKMASEIKVRALIPSCYGDSMLHPEFPEFIHDCKPYNFPYIVIPSTINKFNCDIEDVLKSGIHEFVISWSGWLHYEKYHKGGDLATVLRNMELISSIKDKPVVSVRFHRYKLNLFEEEKARVYCHRLGFRFDPVNAYTLDLEHLITGTYTPQEKAFLEQNLVDNPFKPYKENAFDRNCPMQNKHLTVATTGMARLCSWLHNPILDVADYLATPFSTIRRIQRRHPWCVRCNLSGFRACYKAWPDVGA